jgi:hypothetical protein
MLTYRPRAAPHQPHLCLAGSCMSLKKHFVLYVCVKYMMQMWPKFITQTIYLSIYVFIYVSIYLCIYLSMYLSIYIYMQLYAAYMHACAANGSKPRPASLSSSCPALHSRRLRFPHGHPRFLLLPRRAAPLPRWGLLKHVDMVSTTRNRKKGQDPGKKKHGEGILKL